MNKMLKCLTSGKCQLMVSLPRNDPSLAQAAVEGGAQGLKVHINVHHHASGTHFGAFTEERAALEKILAIAGDIPVGIVPGGHAFATLAEFQMMAEMGVDYFDAYPGDAPAWSLTQPYLHCMLAAFDGASLELIQGLERAGMKMCEASIVEKSQYGTMLDALDIARYAALVRCLKTPIIVPSQKKIILDDLSALVAAGVHGILIGAIVTGDKNDTLAKSTREFRKRLNEINAS